MTYLEEVEQDLATNGHGHVVPRRDGNKTRCGGPPLCSTCNHEKGRFEMAKVDGVACIPKYPSMSFNVFVLTRADLEVVCYRGVKWKSALVYTLPSVCEGRGNTREEALRVTYNRWVKAGCPNSIYDV